MVTSGQSSDSHHQTLPWPEVTYAQAIPTPYQIFHQKKGSPYSKHRFYELVKIYHPDKFHHSIDVIPHAVKLERYRLIIAANNLLSDPVKRGAYDRYGAGWNGRPGVTKSATEGAQSGGGWGNGGDPSQNATWEDWEQWHHKEAGGKQEPYVANGTFVVLIILFATVGTLMQGRQMTNFSTGLIAHIDALHDEMSKDLMRRRNETLSLGSKEERVQEFLKARDPLGYGATDPKEQRRKLPPDHEACSSEDIKDRKTDISDPSRNS
jgi:hypothetical protein